MIIGPVRLGRLLARISWRKKLVIIIITRLMTHVKVIHRVKNRKCNNTSSTCSHNMVNFGPLTAEIRWLVWGTPANFNGFRVLAALLHDTLVVGVSQTAALNRGRHLYSTGRPPRWALAHLLVYTVSLSYS